ncbi:hypothetical protein AVEN_16999-1, partial [Araneus ventricosus]
MKNSKKPIVWRGSWEEEEAQEGAWASRSLVGSEPSGLNEPNCG